MSLSDYGHNEVPNQEISQQEVYFPSPQVQESYSTQISQQQSEESYKHPAHLQQLPQSTLSSIVNPSPKTDSTALPKVSFKTLKMRSKNHITQKPSGSVSSVDKDLLGVKSLRTYYPTEEEFKDPYEYIAKLELQNRYIGAVKIVPPESFNPHFTLDLEKFKFRAVKQSLKHSTTNYDDKLNFYKDLIRFHNENGTPLVRLPSIDKRVVDLYKLRNSVRSKGGFDAVCQRKLWAQIGRELGYTGRIMTSLSSSLKLAYLKILSTYELQLQDKMKTESESESQLNDSNKRPMVNHDHDIHKKQNIGPEMPLISNSKQLFGRQRDVLKAKGFRTNFESYTDERQGLTQVDDSTYPYYDFLFWHKGIEAMDHPYPSTEATRVYNFQQFYDIHLRNSKTLLSLAEAGSHEEEYLTKEFWRIMDEKDHFNVETANYLPSDVFGSGFPTFKDIPKSNKDDITSPWNLNNLPLNEKGILRYLSTDNDSITRPKLTASMLYSVSSWGTGDHFLYSADYLHAGFSKVWYFIPAKDRLKYEQLLVEKIKEHQSRLGNQQGIRDFAKEPLMSDIMDGLKQDDPLDKRSETNNPKFNELYDHNLESNPRFNSDFFISPSVLMENEINVYYTIQLPGEFLIKFPESYSSMISMGGSLSESVNFAPISESWLQCGLDSEQWLCKQSLLPNFSFFELLTNVVENCKDPAVLKIIAPFFDKLVDENLELRSEVKSKIQNIKVISNKFDYISDDDLSCNFPSKVVIYSEGDDFSLSLKSFLKRLETQEAFLSNFDSVELHVYYSDDKMKNLQRTLATFAQTPEDWLAKFEELLTSSTKPTLKSLKSLCYESERIKGDIPEALTLKEYLNDANVWLEKAQQLLNGKQKNRTRNKRNSRDSSNGAAAPPKLQFEPTLVEELIEEVEKLNFTCPEIDQLQEFANDIYQYEASVRMFLSDDAIEHTVDEFYDMIDLGKSFGVKLKSVAFLERIVARNEWLDQYEAIAKKEEARLQYGNEVEKVSLNEFIAFLDRGYEVCGSADLPLIDGVKGKVLLGKFITKTIKEQLASDFNIVTVDELLECTKTVPIDEKVALELTNFRLKHLKTVQERASIESAIMKNQAELQQLGEQNQKRVSGTTDFNKDLYNQLKSKFSGDETDVRPNYTVVKQLVESTKAEKLEAYVKAVETWLRKAKKLFGKSNAPFSVLTTHLQFLSERSKAAFDLNDDYASDSDSNHRYCICRLPESGTMIACEKCNEWYHCKCLKIGRGKTKQVDNYICPICDWRVEIIRDYNRPKLEDLGELVEEGICLDLKSDELAMVRGVYEDGVKFRNFLQSEFQDNYKDPNKIRFYQRKLEGGSTLLLDEYNELRLKLHSLDPSSSEVPIMVSSSTKTKRKRREGTADTTQDVSVIENELKAEVKLENRFSNDVLIDEQLTEPEVEETDQEVKSDTPAEVVTKTETETVNNSVINAYGPLNEEKAENSSTDNSIDINPEETANEQDPNKKQIDHPQDSEPITSVN